MSGEAPWFPCHCGKTQIAGFSTGTVTRNGDVEVWHSDRECVTRGVGLSDAAKGEK